MITKLKFPAVAAGQMPATAVSGDGGPKSPQKTGPELEAELRSEVVRMLWNDVWGQYVTADKWWWEDPEIVDECNRLDTHWDVRMIEAVKQS